MDESDRFKDLEVRDIRLSAVPGLIGCGGCDVLLLKRTAEDLSEMGLTFKLGTIKNSCHSYRTWANLFRLLIQ